MRVGVNVGGWGSVRCKEERELARFGLLSCYGVLFNRRINGGSFATCGISSLDDIMTVIVVKASWVSYFLCGRVSK